MRTIEYPFSRVVNNDPGIVCTKGINMSAMFHYGDYVINRDKDSVDYNEYYMITNKELRDDGEWYYHYLKRSEIALKESTPFFLWEPVPCPYQVAPESSLGFRIGDHVVVKRAFFSKREVFIGKHGFVTKPQPRVHIRLHRTDGTLFTCSYDFFRGEVEFYDNNK